MKIIAVGAGRIIYFLCRNLIKQGYETVLVNGSESECKWFARRLKVTVIHGDGSLPSVLEEAGAPEADAVLALTESDAQNLVICQIAFHKFRVPSTIALVADPINEYLYPKLGVSQVISIARIVSALIEEKMEFSDIGDLFTLAEGHVHVAEVRLSRRSPAAGKRLAELNLPVDTTIACIVRPEGALIPKGGTVLEAGDQIVLVGLHAAHKAAARYLSGAG